MSGGGGTPSPTPDLTHFKWRQDSEQGATFLTFDGHAIIFSQGQEKRVALNAGNQYNFDDFDNWDEPPQEWGDSLSGTFIGEDGYYHATYNGVTFLFDQGEMEPEITDFYLD